MAAVGAGPGQLGERHEVIAPDLPGFGESPRLSGPTTIPTLTDALEAFLAELGIDRPHVAGNSLGGWLTLEKATHTFEPGRIDVPVTIAWGVRDALLLGRQGRRAERLVPGARLVPLPGCGHAPTWDDPALVAQVILDGVGRATYPASHFAQR
jgi:pimeloyl-ACP methyl ester carboxylesterase